MTRDVTPAAPPRILIISPAKDEAEFIGRTIASMAAQVVRPALWVIVNDGSSDRTGELADAAAAAHPWIKVLHRPAGTPRRVGPGVVEAFYDGLALANLAEYDYVGKFDTDLEFGAEYFSTLMAKFAANPKLGTASGKPYLPMGDVLVPERTSDEFSLGAAKLFRRECFEAIGGFVREVMWDGIDCHRCRMLGWEAASYDEPKLRLIHLRMMGSSSHSIFHGRMRWGRGQYFMGTAPSYLLAITGYRMLERPWVLGGLCILGGYVQAAVQRRPRYEAPGFRAHLRGWQRRQLARQATAPLRRLWRRPGKAPAS